LNIHAFFSSHLQSGLQNSRATKQRNEMKITCCVNVPAAIPMMEIKMVTQKYYKIIKSREDKFCLNFDQNPEDETRKVYLKLRAAPSMHYTG
jgi:hypothetical protein